MFQRLILEDSAALYHDRGLQRRSVDLRGRLLARAA